MVFKKEREKGIPMSFAPLRHWTNTSRFLHQAAELAGPLHKVLLEPRKNYLHLPLHVRPWGLESQPFPNEGVVQVDFREAQLRYLDSGGEDHRFFLPDHTQASLQDTLLSALRRDGLAAALDRGAGELDKEKFRHTETLATDRQEAGQYADIQYRVFTGLARFRARLEGAMSPLIVWPHHMDLSTLWFHPSNPNMDEGKKHLNFGFAPYTEGQYELPYLYAYAYPYPEPFEAPPVPEPALWHQEGWRGVVVRYEDLIGVADPEAVVESLSQEVFAALAPLLEG